MIIHELIDELPVHKTKRYRSRDLEKVTTIVIHHSGVAAGRDGFLEKIKRFAAYHIKKHGWPGIGYHYVIDHDGEIWKCNPVGHKTWHARNANSNGIGIMLMGDFTKTQPSLAQRRALPTLVKLIKLRMPQVIKVIGHTEVRGGSVCPGQHGMAMIERVWPDRKP